MLDLHIDEFNDYNELESGGYLGSLWNLINNVYKDEYFISDCIHHNLYKAMKSYNYRVLLLRDISRTPPYKIFGICIYKEDYRSYCGELIYIDTLSTLESGKGYGKRLLDYFGNKKLQLECAHSNNDAHKFYDKYGMIMRANSYVKRGGIK